MRRRTLRGLALGASLLLTATSAVFGGCSHLFRPARSETPGPGIKPLVRVDYSSPDSVLRTMADAIHDKALSNGRDAYVGAFADSLPDGQDARGFHAFFDSGVVHAWELASGRNAPSDWTLIPYERDFYSYFVTRVRPTDDYRLQWTPDDNFPDDNGDPAATLHRQYLVFATPTGGAIVDTIGRGFADLSFVKLSASRWAIVKWLDRVDLTNTNPTQVTLGRHRLDSQ